MRFKLVFSPTRKMHSIAPKGIVAIYDTFKDYREIWFSDNDDQSIRKGIEHFYIQDAIDLSMDENHKKQYVACKMDELPKEDLSFKEVKEID